MKFSVSLAMLLYLAVYWCGAVDLYLIVCCYVLLLISVFVFLSLPTFLCLSINNKDALTNPSSQLPVGCRYCPTGVDRNIISISASEKIISNGANLPSIMTARCQQHTCSTLSAICNLAQHASETPSNAPQYVTQIILTATGSIYT